MFYSRGRVTDLACASSLPKCLGLCQAAARSPEPGLGPECESHRLLPPACTGAGTWARRRQDLDPVPRDPVPQWLPQRLLGDAGLAPSVGKLVEG